MHFFLTSLNNVVYVLSTPKLGEGHHENFGYPKNKKKPKNDDYISRQHILNGKSYPLFDIYQFVESVFLLELESNSLVHDAFRKKFLVSNYNNLKMVDSGPTIEQFHEIQRILGSFKYHNISMKETFCIFPIIDKVPSN